ncbi:MAG: hypothetical protein IJ744_10530 [Lachnospiraceae bacterium]|nr:hypothetical protein [Lachnospiraceae bacterium]
MAKVKLSDGNSNTKREKKTKELSKKAKIIIASILGVAVISICAVFFTKDYKKIEAQNAYTISANDPQILFDTVRDEAYEAEDNTQE